jgi:integral membrane protein (TIGR01906 family)
MSVARAEQHGPTLQQLAWLRPLLSVAFVLCLPLALVGLNVRWVSLDPATYREGFQKYGASERTRLDRTQLEQVAAAFIAYFQAPPGRLDPSVTLDGQRRALFSEREVSHMEDVQQLMRFVFQVGFGAAGFLLLTTTGLLVWRRAEALPALGQLLLWGAGLTFGLLVAVAALSFVDFGELFVRFHQLSFRNDLWMLDPRRDYLLMLFPQGFWFDVTLRIAALTALQAAAIGLLGLVLLRR